MLPEIHGPEQAERVEAEFRKVMATGEPLSFRGWSAELAHRPGEPYFADWSIRRIENPGGEPVGLLLTAVDVTEHVAREQELPGQRRAVPDDGRCEPGAHLGLRHRRAVHLLQPSLARLHGAEPWNRSSATAGSKCLHPEDRSRCLEVYSTAFARRRPFGMTCRLRRHDGEYRWLLDNGAPWLAADGAFLGYIGSCMDVTEQKRLEEQRDRLLAELEARHAFTEAVLRQVPAGILVADAMTGTLFLSNKEAHRFVHGELEPGHRMEEYDEAFELKGFHADGTGYGPDEWPLVRALHKGEVVKDEEIDVVCGDGTPLTLSANAGPVRDLSGQVVAAVAAFHDITDRKRAERAAHFLADASTTLAELVDEDRALQQLAQLAVPHFADWCVVDMVGPDGLPQRLAVAHVDPQKVALAHDVHREYPPNVHAKAGLFQILRSGEAEMVEEVTDEMLTAGARDERHLRILRELGLRSYIGVPLRGRAGTLGVISFIAAESGRRYGPADLRLAQDLAGRAAIAVENARLYEELKDADHRKDEFLATLAHELRNPLAPIRNALRLMAVPQGVDREKERARAERLVVHLSRLVDDLVDVARINRGGIELRKEVVELARVVNRAVEAVQHLAQDRGHDLSVSLPEQPIYLDADPTRLEQVVWNLLSNAIKYTAPGGRIRLAARIGADHVLISVADDGIGIKPETLPHIFDMFARTDSRLTRSEGGLGIGLGLVKMLVEQHGGTIRGESRAGQGERVPPLPADRCRGGRPERRPIRVPGPPNRPGPTGRRNASWWSTTTRTRPRAWQCCSRSSMAMKRGWPTTARRRWRWPGSSVPMW